ncbi:hypothetical protein N7516_010174 [Penicillium verrucosum]|uniref:uncharacterized protein n=1 Tax=Penicillium verrucosum TaxID=60171 RepID=UPI0025454FC9|nr:uncharacterized protein N7516_010174 [Penicillium verrucosum]KAJ5922471.1 hypothetical protein N7516_010174 [Penicillium verrucosum]
MFVDFLLFFLSSHYEFFLRDVLSAPPIDARMKHAEHIVHSTIDTATIAFQEYIFRRNFRRTCYTLLLHPAATATATATATAPVCHEIIDSVVQVLVLYIFWLVLPYP